MANFPNCSFPILSSCRSAEFVHHALSNRQPFSLIRLGDGEGLLLSLSLDSNFGDIRYLISHFGPTGVTIRQAMHLSQLLKSAISTADILGMRTDILDVDFPASLFQVDNQRFEREFKERFRLRDAERDVQYAGCRRLALLHRSLKDFCFDSDSRFSSAWIHYDLVTTGHLYNWLKAQDRIGLITGIPELPSRVEKVFDLRVRSYHIPDMFGRAGDPAISGEHYPKRFHELRKSLTVDFPGMLFLVGAGICGKVYCQWIKEMGGVAIDVGSVFDSWMGRATRPTVFRAKFPKVPKVNGVPSILLLNRQNVELLSHDTDLSSSRGTKQHKQAC